MRLPIIYLTIFIFTMIFIMISALVMAFNIPSSDKDNLKFDFYMHTKAICNETNFCQDYEISCQGSQLVSMTPITGAFIQNPEDWKDPRDKEIKDIFCY